MFPLGGLPVLGACSPARTECYQRASVVPPRIPLPCHATLRHPLRIPCILRAGCVSVVSGRASTLQAFAFRGSAMCRRVNVGLGDLCLLAASSSHNGADL